MNDYIKIRRIKPSATVRYVKIAMITRQNYFFNKLHQLEKGKIKIPKQLKRKN